MAAQRKDEPSRAELVPEELIRRESPHETLKKETNKLQDPALLLLVGGLAQQSGTGCSFEDFTDTVAGPGGTLQVLVGSDLLANLLTLDRKKNNELTT